MTTVDHDLDASRADVRLDPEAWLQAALGGGLPEPTLTRWQPLRVGIVNLWEYDNAEFWFADGRMVLRGGNGAGKTKVLELTTLMLMRGEVAPSILDPFGSQHRTMRYNLLPSGEADDPREPTDSGLGYAWVEFGRRDTDDSCHYFVCGLGASAKRGTGTASVHTWQFITELRPGSQLKLVTGGYPIEEKELKKLPGVWVRNNAAQYRERLARELFGLDPESYDNLTELLKSLRKPKLGERLNPTTLAETLRDSLPPLAGHEVNQLADGWEHLEILRRAVEQTEEAAAAVAAFVRTGWRPWVRATVRRRADALAEATTALDNTTRTKRQAEQTLAEATAALAHVEGEQQRVARTIEDRETQRQELIESQAYQDALTAAQRVEELRRSVDTKRRLRNDAATRLASAQRDAESTAQRVADARQELATAVSEVEDAERSVREHAPAAGLTESAERHLPTQNAASLLADLDGRTERFERLRELHRASVAAERAVEASAQRLEVLRAEADTARRAQEEAAAQLEAEVRGLQDSIRSWAQRSPTVACDEHLVETWCDDVTELTRVDPELGTVLSGRSVVEAIRRHVDQIRDQLTTTGHELRRQRDPLAHEQARVSAELEAARATTEAAPPAPELWRRRERPGPDSAAGAPLWRCLEPDAGVASETLDVIEASLAAAGLLDAWLDPEPGGVDGRLDTLIDAGAPRSGPTLAAVLRPTPVGGVSEERIAAVLGSLGWFPSPPADDHGSWLAADGHWKVGQLHGRVEPARPASYLGATAREAARQRRIAELEQELARLTEELRHIDGQIAEIEQRLHAISEEREQIPSEEPVRDAATVLAERARRYSESEKRVALAADDHRADVQRRDEARAALGRFASEHRFPTTNLDEVDQALRGYRQAANDWLGRLKVLRVCTRAVQSAEQTAAEARRRAEDERAALAECEKDLRAESIRLATAETELRSDHAQRLQRRRDLDQEINDLKATAKELGERHDTAWQAATKARLKLDEHESARQKAEATRDAALSAWWQVVDAGLVAALSIDAPSKRSVEAALAGARAVRRDVDAATDATSLDRAWRRCYTELEAMRQKLLPNRDARVDDTEDGLPPRVLVLTDSGAGWQMPHEAAQTLAERVRSQREAYDAEQHKVLTTLLESTFIEHLKDRLDHTARTFTHINDQLAKHPTRHGHAVRLTWEPDPADPDASAVVAALRQGYQQLVPERQDQVRSFLARRIEEARADTAGPADWKERLAAALDYRRWLRIGLQFRPGSGGSWVPFDAARHGAKSGGEKVVLLSQPLFAAAVVAYNAAGPLAPRWVWLDEAMTGVDTEVKASFMGLTVSFDLDVMITAFDEWCKYETVPAVAIYDLSRHPHLPGVDVQAYLWCGGKEFRVLGDRLGAHTVTPGTGDDLLSLLKNE